MAEDGESSERKHEKSKKRDRSKRTPKIDPNLWTEEEKFQLAEAIDMYGTDDVKKLSLRVPTKKPNHVLHMLRRLRLNNRKEIESKTMNDLQFVDLNLMDDVFMASGTKPKEVMVKWMEYLEKFYNNDPYQFDKFKLFSSAFLIMSECTPTEADGYDGLSTDIDFRKVYYFLYRVFNNYYISKHHKDDNMRLYLHDMFLRVLDDIEYNSDCEKIAMFNIVSNWTGVSRVKHLKVYGKTVPKIEPGLEEESKPNLKETKFKVLQQPMIPSFNPLRLKSSSHTTI